MTSLGEVYFVVGVLTLVAGFTNTVQAVLTPKDMAPRPIASACLGFGLFNIGAGLLTGAGPAAPAPLWLWVMTFAGAVIAAGMVPVTAWALLDLPMTPARLALAAAGAGLGTVRLVGVLLKVTRQPDLNLEQLLTLDALAPAGGLSVLLSAVTWTVESSRAAARRAPYARAMAVFGAAAVVSTVPGLLVSFGVARLPDLFGVAALVFVAFVNTLQPLRYVHALEHRDAPAGDLSRYQLLRGLGSGGMGDVFLARRRGPAGFARDVVIKTLRAREAVAKQRFLSEARVAAQLRHPNIVDVYDLGEQADGFFIVMEHIEGPTLSDVLHRSHATRQMLPPEVIAEIGVQLCRALGFAHAAHVIHRDLKPQNVMLSFSGVAKLIDFGIATEQVPAVAPPAEPPTAGGEAGVAASAPSSGSGSLTGLEGVIGTQGYLAPERLMGAQAAPSSDVFALGVVLYQLLTFRLPYPQQGAELVTAVYKKTAPRLEQLRPDAPLELSRAVEACLAYDPRERPSSAAALEARLERVLTGKRVDLAPWLEALFPQRKIPERSNAPTTPMPQLATPTSPTVPIR